MFKLVLKKCMNTKALEPLLHLAPPEILKYVIGQFSQVLEKAYHLGQYTTFSDSAGFSVTFFCSSESG